MSNIWSKKRAICWLFTLISSTIIVAPNLAMAQSVVSSLQVTKEASVKFANPGTMVEFKTVVKNNGSVQVSGIKVQDLVPIDFVQPGASTVYQEWVVPTLAAGAQFERAYNIKLPENVAAGTYAMPTKVTSQNPEQEQTITYMLEVRDVQVLAEEASLVKTDGLSKVDLLGLVLMAEMLIFAAGSFVYTLRN